MGKTAFIYPGQGAQKPGMGKDFYETDPAAKELYDQASQLLGLDMKKLCFEKNEQLDQTEYTQAALLVTSLAMTQAVQAKGILPDVAAGLSLGEYGAIVAAGGMESLDAIGLVRKRGIYMQEAVPLGEGAMAAVLGLEGEQVEQTVADQKDVWVANYNCPGQQVISGRPGAVEQACAELKERGAKRTILLNVSGPFHCPLLAGAGSRLEQALSEVELHSLNLPYVSNVTAEEVSNADQIKPLLVQQVSSPVKWEQSMRKMIDAGVDTFVEIGPGKTLTGFLKKISKEVQMEIQAVNVSCVEDLKKITQL